MRILDRLANAAYAFCTNIPTFKCACGFETRCGLQSRLHTPCPNPKGN